MLGWYGDDRSGCAIGLVNGFTPDELGEFGQGFVWLRANGVRIYSCYISPNILSSDFANFLTNLGTSIRRRSGDLIIAGDFNAKHTSWDLAYSDNRGEQLATWLAALGLQACNRGLAPTCQCGSSSSIIDVAFASVHVAPKISNWHVANEETYKNHNYIRYTLLMKRTPAPSTTATGWAWRKLEYSKLHLLLDGNHNTNGSDQLMEVLTEACNASMPRRNFKHNCRKPQYWWNSDIAEKRKIALAARRAYQRVKRRKEAAIDEHAYMKEARRELRLAIRRSQEACWRALCAEVDRDPWGTPYRVVMRLLGRRPPVPIQLVPGIIDSLFPMHLLLNRSYIIELTPKFTLTELKAAVHRFPNGKTPGPDGVSNKIVKAASKCPYMFLNAFNYCIESGNYPDVWKKATLVLLSKDGKPPE